MIEYLYVKNIVRRLPRIKMDSHVPLFIFNVNICSSITIRSNIYCLFQYISVILFIFCTAIYLLVLIITLVAIGVLHMYKQSINLIPNVFYLTNWIAVVYSYNCFVSLRNAFYLYWFSSHVPRVLATTKLPTSEMVYKHNSI